MTDGRPEFPATDPEDDVNVRVTEPSTAGRSSPHAIASLVVAALALSGAPRFFPPIPLFDAGASVVASTLVGIATELALAITALWLARAGDVEIASSDGRLGGIGFATAGRVLAVIAIAASLVGVAVQLVPQGRSGGGVVEMGSEYPDFSPPPGPLTPESPPPPNPVVTIRP